MNPKDRVVLFFSVFDHEAFGKLIRNWAGDIDQIPKTIEEFSALLTANGISHELPQNSPMPDLKGVNIIELADDKLNVVIPSAKMIEEAEKVLLSTTGPYILPDEYDLVYDSSPVSNLSQTKRLKVGMARIADYSISSCM